MYFLKKITQNLSKCRIPIGHFRYSTQNSAPIKVTLCGAAGQVGQPLSLLLKQSPFIDELALFDSEITSGLSMELSQVDTNCSVSSYSKSTISEAFKGANVVVVANGSNLTAQQNQTKCFDKNGMIVKNIMAYVARFCPQALIAIATCPVEGMLPLASETLKYLGTYDPSKVFGVTTLNVVRANTFTANVLGLEPECVMVPVIGGNTEGSVIPLLSQALPCSDFTEDEIENITKSLQNADSILEKVKCFDGPALSTAFSIARFVISLIKGLKGHTNILEYSFIRTNDVEQIKYFSVPLFLGPGGVQKDLGIPNLSPYETCLVEEAISAIRCWVDLANKFTGTLDPKLCNPCDPDLKTDCPEDKCAKRRKSPLS